MLDLPTVKAWLEKEDDQDDDRLEALMLRAIEAVQRETDWYFGLPRDTQEIHSGDGCHALYLRQPPVDGLTVYTRSGLTVAWEEVDAELWELEGRAVYHAYGYWLPGTRNWRFDYQEGFAVAPGDVQQFTLDLIAAKWESALFGLVESETIGRYSYTLGSGDVTGRPGWPLVANNWRRGRI